MAGNFKKQSEIVLIGLGTCPERLQGEGENRRCPVVWERINFGGNRSFPVNKGKMHKIIEVARNEGENFNR